MLYNGWTWSMRYHQNRLVCTVFFQDLASAKRHALMHVQIKPLCDNACTWWLADSRSRKNSIIVLRDILKIIIWCMHHNYVCVYMLSPGLRALSLIKPMIVLFIGRYLLQESSTGAPLFAYAYVSFSSMYCVVCVYMCVCCVCMCGCVYVSVSVVLVNQSKN